MPQAQKTKDVLTSDWPGRVILATPDTPPFAIYGCQLMC